MDMNHLCDMHTIIYSPRKRSTGTKSVFIIYAGPCKMLIMYSLALSVSRVGISWRWKWKIRSYTWFDVALPPNETYTGAENSVYVSHRGKYVVPFLLVVNTLHGIRWRQIGGGWFSPNERTNETKQDIYVTNSWYLWCNFLQFCFLCSGTGFSIQQSNQQFCLSFFLPFWLPRFACPPRERVMCLCFQAAQILDDLYAYHIAWI